MIYKVLVCLYLFIGFWPTFGSIDRHATQFLILNILNVVSFGYLIFSRDLFNIKWNKFVLSTSFILGLSFFVLSGFSTIYAINKPEAIITSFHQLSLIIAILVLAILLFKIENRIKFITDIMCISLILETYSIAKPFIEVYSLEGLVGRSNKFSGIGANINISAFSLIYKLPFLLYRYSLSKNSFINHLLYSFITTIVITSIYTILATRGAMIASIALLVILIFYSFYFLIKSKSKLFLKPLFLFSFSFIVSIGLNLIISDTEENQNIVNRFNSVDINNDKSSAQRLRYWKGALNMISKNPFLGIGKGSYKLLSIKEDSKDMYGYTVPYHAHNDFLEITAELGIIGFIFYYGMFILLVIFLFSQIFNNNKLDNYKFFMCTLLMFIAMYFIDSFINFPFARPFNQIVYIFILSFGLIHAYEMDKNSRLWKINFYLFYVLNLSKKRISKFLILFIIFLFPFSLYCSYKYYKSYVDQAYLVVEYNQKVFARPLEVIEKIQYTFPNITASTLPISDIIGLYYKSNGQENKALELYREGIKANPYLGGSEALISDIYFDQNKNDSAIYYGKKSWEKLPRNAIHFAYYVSALSRIRDTLKINEVYENIPNRNSKESDDYVYDDIFLAALTDVIDIDVKKKYVKDLNEQIFSKKDFMKINLYFLNFGKEQVLRAEKIYNKGMTFFDQKDFYNAAPLLEEAAKLNSLQNAYFENAGNAYLKIKNYDKSLEMLNFVIDSLKPKTGKAQYLKALVYLNQSEDNKACKVLREAINLGFKPAEQVLGAFCYK